MQGHWAQLEPVVGSEKPLGVLFSQAFLEGDARRKDGLAWSADPK
jgi:hypothetical protein